MASEFLSLQLQYEQVCLREREAHLRNSSFKQDITRVRRKLADLNLEIKTKRLLLLKVSCLFLALIFLNNYFFRKNIKNQHTQHGWQKLVFLNLKHVINLDSLLHKVLQVSATLQILPHPSHYLNCARTLSLLC